MRSEHETDGTAAGTPASDRFGMISPRSRPGPWIATVLLVLAFGVIVWEFVGMLTVGLFVYYVTRPIFRRLENRIGSRLLAVSLTLILGALPVLLIVGWTIFLAYRELASLLGGPLGDQFDAFIGRYLGEDLSAVAELRRLAERIIEDPTRITAIDLGPVLTSAWEMLSAVLGAVVVIALNLFVILVVAFYLLKDDYKIADWARGTIVEPDGVVEEFFVHVDYDLEKVFFGNILNALVTGIIAVTVFLGLNYVSPDVVSIPEPILLGLLVGAASLVPLVGIKLVTVPIMAYLFGAVLLLNPQALWFPVAFAVLSFVVVDYIPDQLLRPYVSGRNLHVGAIILAYAFGPLLFGWYGIFLGPLLLVVGFEFARIVLPWLLTGTPPALGDDADEPGGPAESSDATGSLGPAESASGGSGRAEPASDPGASAEPENSDDADASGRDPGPDAGDDSDEPTRSGH